MRKRRKRLRHLKPKRKQQSVTNSIIVAFIWLWVGSMVVGGLISLLLIAG